MSVIKRKTWNYQVIPEIDFEHPKGKSEVVPGQDVSIAELLDRLAKGVPLSSPVREGLFPNDPELEDDFDQEDLEKLSRADIYERQEQLTIARNALAQAKAAIESIKKTDEKPKEVKTGDEDAKSQKKDEEQG